MLPLIQSESFSKYFIIIIQNPLKSDKKFIHLITVERNKPYTLMAENAGLTQRWVSVIANARQSQLKRVFEDETSSKLNPANRSESQTAITDLTKSVICEIQKLPGNQFCADCRKPNPDWLSVNLGILVMGYKFRFKVFKLFICRTKSTPVTVCLNCSGLHRKLGVNYSKIQSIELDNLGTASLLIARKVGNELFNEAYEGTDTGMDKPNAESSQMTRDNFITRKYIDKAYVQRTAHHKDLAKGMGGCSTFLRSLK